MPSTMVEFTANGGSARGYLATPKSGRAPGVLVIQEWWGLVDHIKQVADRVAAEGFVALAPDLYKGETTKSPDQAGKMRMALNIGETAKALRGAAEFLMGSDAVQPKKVGVMGFCMGGQLALFAACEHPDLIGPAVDFYGIHPKVELRVERLRGAVLAHFATRDTSVPPEQAKALVQRLEAAGKRVEAYFYEADHAFMNDARPEVYKPDDARLAWDRTMTFLRRELSA
jgi:carboxymethylenebutenolidase